MKLNNEIYNERKPKQVKKQNRKVSKRAKPASQVSRTRQTTRALDAREEQVRRSVQKRKKLTRKERNQLKRVREREEIIRETNMRKNKKHKRNYVLYYILLGFFVLLTGAILSLTVFFKIETITVVGVENNIEQIVEQSGIEIGDNLFRVNSKSVKEKILSKNIDIDKVTVKRKLPSTLVIEVEMAEPKFTLQNNSTYYLVSKNNRIIKSDPKPVDGVVVVYGCKVDELELGGYIKKEGNNKILTLELILNAISEEKLTSIVKIDMSDMIAVKLYYNNQFLINLGEATSLNYKIAKVKQLVETKLSKDENGIIDVSINGKTFYRVVEDIEQPDLENKEEMIPDDITSDTSSEDVSSKKDEVISSKENTSGESGSKTESENSSKVESETHSKPQQESSNSTSE